MSGELSEDSVIIKCQKEGSRIYGRGNYGYPLSKGGLELDLIEALYLLESGRLEVVKDGQNLTFEELFSYSASVRT